MATAKLSRLGVFMNGVTVGQLSLKSSGAMAFQYDDTWLNNTKLSRPISLSLPLTKTPYSGDIVENWFDNLLPDRPDLREQLRRRFVLKSPHPFYLLAQLGRDCIGAVQLLPNDETPNDLRQIDANRLSDEQIATMLRGVATAAAPLGIQADDDFRISLAGAQEKTALLWHEDHWCLPKGSTPTTHIFKLPMGRMEQSGIDLSRSIENEWLCQQLIAAMGIPVAETALREFNGVKALAVSRFDRQFSKSGDWIVRLPQEDFCQALGIASRSKYESDGGPSISACMQLLEGCSNPLATRLLFFEIQVLFWALAAIDGHGKNFSIFINSGGQFEMTPLYDVISLFPTLAEKQVQPQKAKMAMAFVGKNKHYRLHEIHPRHFLSTANKCRISNEQAEAILRPLPEKWRTAVFQVAADIGDTFPSDIATTIFDGLQASADKLQKFLSEI